MLAVQCGPRESTADRDAPPAVPVIVTELVDVTCCVRTSNVALVLPAGTETLDGTVARELLAESDTTVPPDGAGPLSVTVPAEGSPLRTLVGLRVRSDRETADAGGGVGVGAGEEGGFTVSVAVLVTPAPDTEMVTVVGVVTIEVVMLKPPAVVPAGIVTLFGMTAIDGLLLVRGRVRSEAAGDAIVTVPEEPVVPETVAGLSVNEVGGCCGVRVSCVWTVMPFQLALIVVVVLVETAFVGTLTVTD